MDVCSALGKGRVRVRMGDIFAFKERDMAVGAVDVFFYVADPEEWEVSVLRAVFGCRVVGEGVGDGLPILAF